MSDKITKVVIEWANGDKRTFENPEGLQGPKLKEARRLLNADGDKAEKETK